MEESAPAVGEWIERPLLANKQALGLPEGEEVPEPVTVWDKRTEDGQRIRVTVFGQGHPEDPWVLRVTTSCLEREKLAPGQTLGTARFPSVLELQEVANLLPEGAIVTFPQLVAGQPVPTIERFTLFQVSQIAALADTPAGRTWQSAIVRPTLTSEPGRA